MSWLTRLKETELIIITGDGKTYKPLWKNSIKNIRFNTEGFDFIGIQGTYVERKEMQGKQYPILLYFQGEDCIDQSNAFELSAQDKRPWKISHPFYGEISVQPLNLTIDNSQYNVSKITGVVWETISQKYPSDEINAIKEIEFKKSELDEETEAVFVDEIETPSPETIDPANDSVLNTGSRYNVLIQSDSDAALLKDKIRTASSAAQGLISDASRYISQAIDLINFPFLIKQNVNQKVDQMLNVFNDFASIFLGSETTEEKQILYESQSTTLLTELSKNLINTDIEEFGNRSSVVLIIESLFNAYNTFLTNLDDLSYDQNKELSLKLDYIINFTLGSLSDVAFNSKQERTHILEKDNNIINLAHRFYGPGDDNIDLFISQNDIALKEYLILKKGRKIVYYV